jgi:hypothetical protein
MLVDHPKLLVCWRCPHGLGYLHNKHHGLGERRWTAVEQTHRLNMTLMGIGGYLNSLPRFFSLLDLGHRILVVGVTIHHVCTGVLAVSEWYQVVGGVV